MYSNKDKPIKKDTKKPKLDVSKLPPSLKERYEAMGLLPQKPIQKASVEVNLEKIKIRKIDKEKSIEEKLEEIQITATETKALERVFQLLCHDKSSFNAKDIADMLQNMGLILTKSEIDLMLWEIDENLDGSVDWKEFLNMYKKCTGDKNGLEPKSLFHMVQFLMFCSKVSQTKKYTITVEDTLELLYVRFGRNSLDDEILAIFGAEEKTKDGQEKEIDFSQYLERINARAIELRKNRKEKQKQIYSYQKQSQSNNFH